MSLASLPAIASVVPCGGERHPLRWEGGVLVAPAHPDLEGERALGALGGTTAGCVALVDAWQRCHQDPAMLVLLPRGPVDRLPLPEAEPVAQRGRPMRPTARRRMARRARAGGTVLLSPGTAPTPVHPQTDLDRRLADTRLLCALGPAMLRRLVATVTAHLLATPAPPTATLTASLFGRVAASLRLWAGTDVDIDLDVVGEAAQASLTQTGATTLGVRLPLSWVVDVWGRGADLLDDRFTLAVVTDHPATLRYGTVDHTFAPQPPVVLAVS